MAPLTRSATSVKSGKSTDSASRLTPKSKSNLEAATDIQRMMAVVVKKPSQDPKAKDSAVSQHASTAAAMVSQQLPPNVFPLLSLPQEIVDMVYRELIQDGQTAILRTSREVHDQASSLVAKHGIHRIRYNGSSLVPRRHKLRPRSAKKIQTVEVQMEFNGEKPLHHGFHFAELSLGKPVVRDLCHIIARFDLFTSYGMLFVLSGQLRLFRTVIIEFRVCLTSGFGERPVSDKAPGFHRLSKMKLMHEVELGPSTWCECGLAGARHLEFHPVRHLQI